MIRQSRIFLALMIMTFAIGILGTRLLWLQAHAAFAPDGDKHGAVTRSVAQRAKGAVLDSGRGTIVDRNGEPLAGIPIRSLLLLPVQSGFPAHEKIVELARIIGVDPAYLENTWQSLTQPGLWLEPGGKAPIELTSDQDNRIQALGAPGAIPVDAVRRYPRDGTAQQLIGFVAEWPERIQAAYSDRLQSGALTAATPIGASGLELAFDRFLQGIGTSAVALHTDNRGQPLSGIGIRKTVVDNAYYPLQLVSTIDKRLQQRIEEAADQSGLTSGSVVVLDARTADVIALVSRPQFEPNVAHGSKGSWRNHALVSITPGSVYKSVIAAAALEEGVVSPKEHFFCDGDYGKYGLTCWKEGGHGHVTFEEGFAQSCNIVFAQVAERLSAAKLKKYAEAFGITGRVGWSGTSSVDGKALLHFPEEEAGTVFAKGAGTIDGGVLAQTGIGQRDVRMTPLSAANWIVTLLHDGDALTPRAASEIRFADERTMEKYAIRQLSSPGSGLSSGTADMLKSMMVKVVEEGTGTALKRAEWKLAGKSGTAEVTVQGKPFVHQWFVGYGPAESPRYAAAVVFERRPPNSPHAAITLFKEVMDVLAEASDP